MLVATLVCSSILLFFTNRAMRKGFTDSVIGQCVVWIGFSIFFFILPAHFKLCIALLLTAILASWFRSIRHYFIPISLSLALGIYTWQALSDSWEMQSMRDEFPLIDMATRLPAREVSDEEPLLIPVSQERLNRLERNLEDRSSHRHWVFQRLHEHAVVLFAGNPGFGALRMPSVWSRWQYRYAMREEEVPEQPTLTRPDELSPSQWKVNLTETVETPFDQLHEQGQQEFLKPERYGYIKKPQLVAGFLSHQFNQQPVDKSLTLKRLDLISLILHPEPVAYDTKKLPKMEDLRTSPTRPLELFESTAVRALRQGEDLVVNESATTTWMVGALRATKQCLSCHDVNRGELLGAFSYVLERPQ